jgi:hypothetical protein
MTRRNARRHLIGPATLLFALAAAVSTAALGSDDDADYCMTVDLGPFHMVPGFMTPEGACAVRDYWDGELQESLYPFTIGDHLFNCEKFGDLAPLPTGDEVPSSVKSEGDITGTIGGHAYTGTLFCASLTNWYEEFCPDPLDPEKPCFQLAQPFFNLIDRDPYPRVTEVSIFDGVITVERGNGKVVDVPVLMATRAAGITHLEGLDPPQVGASVTHSLLGLLTYEIDDDEVESVEQLDGSLDALLQGHIFFPVSVEDDPGAARVRGALCSKDLYKLLNRRGKPSHRKDDD